MVSDKDLNSFLEKKAMNDEYRNDFLDCQNVQSLKKIIAMLKKKIARKEKWFLERITDDLRTSQTQKRIDASLKLEKQLMEHLKKNEINGRPLPPEARLVIENVMRSQRDYREILHLESHINTSQIPKAAVKEEKDSVAQENIRCFFENFLLPEKDEDEVQNRKKEEL